VSGMMLTEGLPIVASACAAKSTTRLAQDSTEALPRASANEKRYQTLTQGVFLLTGQPQQATTLKSFRKTSDMHISW
jgi:hypothetical protein